jgi:hypothetical protein
VKTAYQKRSFLRHVGEKAGEVISDMSNMRTIPDDRRVIVEFGVPRVQSGTKYFARKD